MDLIQRTDSISCFKKGLSYSGKKFNRFRLEPWGSVVRNIVPFRSSCIYIPLFFVTLHLEDSSLVISSGLIQENGYNN